MGNSVSGDGVFTDPRWHEHSTIKSTITSGPGAAGAGTSNLITDGPHKATADFYREAVIRLIVVNRASRARCQQLEAACEEWESRLAQAAVRINKLEVQLAEEREAYDALEQSGVDGEETISGLRRDNETAAAALLDASNRFAFIGSHAGYAIDAIRRTGNAEYQLAAIMRLCRAAQHDALTAHKAAKP